MSDLKQLSIEKLRSIRDDKQNEIVDVEGEIACRITAELAVRQEWYLNNIDVLLQLVPKHYRRGCTDEQLYVATNDCMRCYLLDCKRSHCWLDPEIDLDIDMMLFNIHCRAGYFE